MLTLSSAPVRNMEMTNMCSTQQRNDNNTMTSTVAGDATWRIQIFEVNAEAGNMPALFNP